MSEVDVCESLPVGMVVAVRHKLVGSAFPSKLQHQHTSQSGRGSAQGYIDSSLVVFLQAEYIRTYTAKVQDMEARLKQSEEAASHSHLCVFAQNLEPNSPDSHLRP